MTYEQDRDAAERRDRLRAKGEDVLSETRAAASQVADRASAAVEDQKSTFAAQIDDISKAAKTAASDLRDRDQGLVADWVERTADGIHNASESLRNNDLKTIYGEVESFARRQPAAFIAGTALLGFAVSRFAKVASDRREDTPASPVAAPARIGAATPPQGGPIHD